MSAAHERAPRVLVVSLQKAGTHLVAALMRRLGYRVAGMIMADQPETSLPLYPGALNDDTDEAFAILCWLDRLGGDVRGRYSAAWARAVEQHGDPVRRALSRFADLPAGLCLVTHDLRLRGADGGFVRDWVRTGQPPIIFNYRDPRDVLVSFVHYLTGRTAQGRHGGFAEYHLYGQLLAALPDDDARLMHAIVDVNFPGHDEFAQHVWMLRHPRVCQVRYEELVGAPGGGSDAARARAVARVLEFLGIADDPEPIAADIYNPGAATFARGTVGAWREGFKPDHTRAFERHHGDLLRQYGYGGAAEG